MNNDKRTIALTCHVNESEYRLIIEKMKQLDIKSFSKYARLMMLQGRMSELDYPELETQSRAVRKISNTIEELVSLVENDSVELEREIKEIKLAIVEIWRLQKLNLMKYRVL